MAWGTFLHGPRVPRRGGDCPYAAMARALTNSLQLHSCKHVFLALTLTIPHVYRCVCVMLIEWSRTLCSCAHVHMQFWHSPSCVQVCVFIDFSRTLCSCAHVDMYFSCVNRMFKDSLQLRSCRHVAQMQTCRYLLVVLTSSTHQQYLLVVLTSSTHQQYLLVVLSSGTYLQYLVVVPIAVVPSTTGKYHYQVLLDRKTVIIRVQCSDVALE